MEVSRWPIVWLFLSSLVVIWDCCFVLLRPHSLPNGSLHPYFTPYSLYIQIDKAYGDVEDEFVWAQAWLNVVEVCIAFIAIFLTLLKNPNALVIGLIVSVMTFWKTVLYMIQYTDICQGGHRLRHLEIGTMIMVFVIPNGVWLVFPLILIVYYSRKLVLLNQKPPTKKD